MAYHLVSNYHKGHKDVKPKRVASLSYMELDNGRHIVTMVLESGKIMKYWSESENAFVYQNSQVKCFKTGYNPEET